MVSFFEFSGVGQSVVTNLNSVTDRLQMLTGIMIHIMQPIPEVHHVVDADCTLSSGILKNMSQGRKPCSLRLASGVECSCLVGQQKDM
jgi:hypothetical protein